LGKETRHRAEPWKQTAAAPVALHHTKTEERVVRGGGQGRGDS